MNSNLYSCIQEILTEFTLIFKNIFYNYEQNGTHKRILNNIFNLSTVDPHISEHQLSQQTRLSEVPVIGIS